MPWCGVVCGGCRCSVVVCLPRGWTSSPNCSNTNPTNDSRHTTYAALATPTPTPTPSVCVCVVPQALSHEFFDELRQEGTRLPNSSAMPELFTLTDDELEQMAPEHRTKVVPDWFSRS